MKPLPSANPLTKESDVYLKILKDSVADLGLKEGVILGLTPIFLTGTLSSARSLPNTASRTNTGG